MTNTRDAFTLGLRYLADALENIPDLPLPYTGRLAPLAVFTNSAKDLLAYRLLLGPVERKVTDLGVYDFQMQGHLAGLQVRVYAPVAVAMPGLPVTT